MEKVRETKNIKCTGNAPTSWQSKHGYTDHGPTHVKIAPTSPKTATLLEKKPNHPQHRQKLFQLRHEKRYAEEWWFLGSIFPYS
jgi:hypothetical protein